MLFSKGFKSPKKFETNWNVFNLHILRKTNAWAEISSLRLAFGRYEKKAICISNFLTNQNQLTSYDVMGKNLHCINLTPSSGKTVVTLAFNHSASTSDVVSWPNIFQKFGFGSLPKQTIVHLTELTNLRGWIFCHYSVKRSTTN